MSGRAFESASRTELIIPSREATRASRDSMYRLEGFLRVSTGTREFVTFADRRQSRSDIRFYEFDKSYTGVKLHRTCIRIQRHNRDTFDFLFRQGKHAVRTNRLFDGGASVSLDATVTRVVGCERPILAPSADISDMASQGCFTA